MNKLVLGFILLVACSSHATQTVPSTVHDDSYRLRNSGRYNRRGYLQLQGNSLCRGAGGRQSLALTPVGKAIKKSGVAMEDFFIMTKLWIQSNGYEGTKKAFENSLKRLQLDYLDLYLIHQPFGDVYGEWRAMQELYKEGRVRAIGVSNFHPDRVIDLIIHNDIVPAVNQIETHPFHQQNDTQKFLQVNNVQIESWGPLPKAKTTSFITSCWCQSERNIIKQLHKLSFAGLHKEA